MQYRSVLKLKIAVVAHDDDVDFVEAFGAEFRESTPVFGGELRLKCTMEPAALQYTRLTGLVSSYVACHTTTKDGPG